MSIPTQDDLTTAEKDFLNGTSLGGPLGGRLFKVTRELALGDLLQDLLGGIKSLALTTANAGASLIGIEDLNEYFAGADVEAVTQDLGARAIRTTDVTISSAEILALNAVPKAVGLSIPIGDYLEFVSAELLLDWDGGSAYAGIAAGEDWVIQYAGGVELARIETTGFLDQTNDERRLVKAAAAVGAVADVEPPLGADLQIAQLVDEITTGTSPVKVRVFYRQHTALAT